MVDQYEIESGIASNINIALVRVLGNDRFDANTADYNVGLCTLSMVAQQHNARVALFDPYDPLDQEAHFEQLVNGKFDLVGFTLHYLNVEETLGVSKSLKALNKHCVIVYGGHHASATAKELLDDHSHIDAVCVGEGEDVLVQLIQLLEAGKTSRDIRRQGIFTPRKFYDLDQLPWSANIGDRTIARLVTSRGCPYSCTFCTTPAMRELANEPVYRTRSPKNVVDEMEQLYSNGISHFYINDDLYAVPNAASHTRVREIADEILRRGLKLSYKVQLRVDSFQEHDFDLLKYLRVSGLREVFLGVESGSDITLEKYNKGATRLNNIEAIRLYDKAGIKVNAGNIVATYDSSREEIRDSIHTFAEMQIAYLFFRRVTFRVVALPGTRLERQLMLLGVLEQRPRYYLRQYEFANPQIATTITLLEEAMPGFLQRIGAEVFRLRNKAIVLNYEARERNKTVDPNLQEVLNNWSRVSANFLLKWFYTPPVEANFPSDFEIYIQYVQGVKEALLRYLASAEVEEFDSDSF